MSEVMKLILKGNKIQKTHENSPPRRDNVYKLESTSTDKETEMICQPITGPVSRAEGKEKVIGIILQRQTIR